MDKQDWLAFALADMHSGQWYGWKKDWTGEHRMSYENLIVHDSSITKPTEDEVNAKIQELKDAEQAAINKKTSGKQKLKDLGLDDDEIKALMGV
jgi:arsenate reductase-like glutaredoxin family protein